MPNYLLVTGISGGATQAKNLTRFIHPIGYVAFNATEAFQQLIARDSYILSNLFVYVSANTITNTTTVRSRKQTPPGAAANGNQSVSIPNSTTGAFTDSVNADSLVNGDLFCTSSVTPNVGTSIIYTIFSYILSTLSNTTPILAVTGSTTQDKVDTRYIYVEGNTKGNVTEIKTYYKLRVAATLSNMRVYVSANTVTADSTLRIRINADYGNQAVTILASTTGAFEDTTNSDNISSGQNVNYELITGWTGTSLTYTSIQVKSNSLGRQLATGYPGTDVLVFGTTTYVTVEGISQSFNSDETLVQATARVSFTAKNMYVNVITTNSLNGSTTFRLRKNTGNSNLVVSVGAGLTGQFEDIDPTHTTDFVAADLINWSVVTGGTSGSIIIGCIGFELKQPIAIIGPFPTFFRPT